MYRNPAMMIKGKHQMSDQITNEERNAIDASIASGNVTKTKPGRAKGVTKRTAPQTTAKPTRAKRKTTRNETKPATKRAKGTLTTVDIAEQHDMNAKTLRARIRRNIDKWEPLFKDGVRHMFADNSTTRKAIAALLDA